MDQACLKMWEHGYYLLVKCEKSQFLMGKSPLSMGKSLFSMGKSPFLMGKLTKLTKKLWKITMPNGYYLHGYKCGKM